MLPFFCLLNLPCIPAILKINSNLSEHFIHIEAIVFVNHPRKNTTSGIPEL